MNLAIGIISLICFEGVIIVNILTERRKLKLKDYVGLVFIGLVFLVFLRIFCGV